MLRLIIMRHAKSDWSNEVLSDHQRPLNKRGQSDAPVVAKRLRGLGWEPGRVLCSTAQRTRETLARMLPEWSFSPEISYRDTLYLAGPRQLGRELSVLGVEVKSVMALGHNPGWQNAVEVFTGEPAEMKTCYAALLESDCESWPDATVADPSWRLVEVVMP